MALNTTLLRMRVHAQALAHAPVAYLQAVIWRVRGLRLRSRHRFSALMGHASGAYGLWIHTREKALAEALYAQGLAAPAICVVIDARQDDAGVADTLRSVAVAQSRLGASRAPDAPVLVLGNTGPDLDTVPGAANPALAVEFDTLAQYLSRFEAAASAAGKRPFVLPVKAGDRLSPMALAGYADAILRHRDCALFYADDDLLDASGKRHSPHFKPSWNSELARHHDFLSGSCLIAVDAVRFDKTWPDLAQHDLAFFPMHVPLVLHHRRTRPSPIMPRSVSAAVSDAALPHVSVVIPTRNQSALLRTCIAGLEQTEYPSLDVTVIDNGSDDAETLSLLQELSSRGIRIVRDDGPFNFAALHNRAVPQLRGPLLCFLNNDVEMLDRRWLSRMVPCALRPDVGSVGARLLYPDRTIQHAGIVIGIGGGAAHAHRGEHVESTGYFERTKLPQFVSAVTAACMVIEKAKYEVVGGFDEEAFFVAFNDVDLCLKLNAAGFQSFYEPGATLIHHESKSRGFDRKGKGKLRFAGELARLKEIWGTDRLVDPFHHPELSPFSERFVVRL